MQKKLQRISLEWSEELHRAWKMKMRQFAAEDLVFLDESIFNEKTGWRYQAYEPIGSTLRYPADTQRGCTWSICAAMTVDGYVPCTGVKEGYFKMSDLLNWLQSMLLPALCMELMRPHVVMLNNCSTHIDEVIIKAIENEDHIVHFLLSYSLNYNLIELTFSVLKSWLKQNYVWTHLSFKKFGDYLIWAIEHTRCDRFAREQFRHAAGGIYLEEGEIERFQTWLQDWEKGSTEEEDAEIEDWDRDMEDLKKGIVSQDMLELINL